MFILFLVVLLSNFFDVMATQTPLNDRRSGGTISDNRVVAAMATWEFGTLAVEECVALLQQEGRFIRLLASYTAYHDHTPSTTKKV